MKQRTWFITGVSSGFPKWACHRQRNERNCADQMKTNRKYADKTSIAEEESPGMEAKSKEFMEKGAEVYAKT